MNLGRFGISHGTMERELSALFAGRTIDLRTAPELSPYFRDEVIKTASIQYAAQ